jgi:hypothetical protein
VGWVKQDVCSGLYACNFCINSSGRRVISDSLDQVVRMGWTVSKKIGRKLVDEVSDGSNTKGALQMAEGIPPGIEHPLSHR